MIETCLQVYAAVTLKLKYIISVGEYKELMYRRFNLDANNEYSVYYLPSAEVSGRAGLLSINFFRYFVDAFHYEQTS